HMPFAHDRRNRESEYLDIETIEYDGGRGKYGQCFLIGAPFCALEQPTHIDDGKRIRHVFLAPEACRIRDPHQLAVWSRNRSGRCAARSEPPCGRSTPGPIA